MEIDPASFLANIFLHFLESKNIKKLNLISLRSMRESKYCGTGIFLDYFSAIISGYVIPNSISLSKHKNLSQ